MALLELKDVGRRIGGTAAVDGFTLSVEEGEIFALLGPAGCGKSTLLRLLAGFERPDRGSIVLDGIDITELPARYRPLNLMFQSQALFPHMSVAANVAYGLEMEGLRRREIRRRVAEILEALDIRDCARRRPHQLAADERQRAALARALVKRPRVLLLDEPLAPLDRRLRHTMHLELKRLQQEFAVTILLVTQDAEAALATSDRMAVMRQGRVLQHGTRAAALRTAGEPMGGRAAGRRQPAGGLCRRGRRARAAPGPAEGRGCASGARPASPRFSRSGRSACCSPPARSAPPTPSPRG